MREMIYYASGDISFGSAINLIRRRHSVSLMSVGRHKTRGAISSAIGAILGL